ncbi:MAG: thioredoxin family protein [Bdellovibrionales bacterium CG10_big_fil_rev_8_21_14_0_10_45_34]|nr:MAG: thioredoxin family protein [Bdellovibrionales bacterium CG10_big_fil_rev_8_21_14_0_10_45_34]
MRKRISLLVGLMTLASFIQLAAAPKKSADVGSLKVGSLAPGFTLTDTNGKEHSLSDYKGKTVVLEWLSHDCPFVKKHYESNNMQTLQKKYTADGVVWLSVNSSAPGKEGFYKSEEANKLTTEKGAAPTAVLVDSNGKVGRIYGAKTTPHMFVIDKAGNLAYMGAIDSIKSADKEDIAKAENYVSKALDSLKGGKPVTLTATSPYGCSVKY